MSLLDRHIALRYLWNVAVVFSLLFVFAVTIDVIVQLDRFVEAADAAVARGEFVGRLTALPAAVFDFHGPRIFQFYAYLLGLVTIAAMGFTLTQMHRARELVAMLTAGMSLQRIARPMLLATLLLNLGLLVNSELVLPRLAPLLVREHGEILAAGMRKFPLELTRDARGTLILARAYDPSTETLEELLAIERDADGGATRRVTADRAVWDRASRSWKLVGGVAMRAGEEVQPLPGAPGLAGAAAGTNSLPATDARMSREPLDFLASDLDPSSITIRRSAAFAQMLSMGELREVEEAQVIDPDLVSRARWGRFAGIVANVVVFLLALPSFLLREPANLLRQSVVCAGISISAFLFVLVGLTVSLPGVSPAMLVFAPSLMVAPLALGRFLAVKT